MKKFRPTFKVICFTVAIVVFLLGVNSMMFGARYRCRDFFPPLLCILGSCMGTDAILDDCVIEGCNAPPYYKECREPH